MSRVERLRATLAIAAANQIGEGPVWDAPRARLVWVDHVAGSVHIGIGAGDAWREDRRLGLGKPVVAALPRSHGGFRVVGAADVALLDEDGHCESVTMAPFDSARLRFNEAKCDATGRLWAGALDTDLRAGGAVYCLDAHGHWQCVLTDAILPNGMDWSPDGTRFYFVDSVRQTLEVFVCDLVRATLGERRVLVDFSALRGAPNGLCVDRDGTVWVAVTGGGQVHGYTSDGVLRARIDVPTRAVTSCAVGGSNADILFITSRSGRLPKFALSFGIAEHELECSEPHAGALFICPLARGAQRGHDARDVQT